MTNINVLIIDVIIMKLKNLPATLFSLCFLALPVHSSIKVHYVKLSNGTVIESNPIKEYEQRKCDNGAVSVLFYPNIEFQTIEGIGGAFNEIGGDALMALDKGEREEVMRNLFSLSGAHFSFCRTAVGASDFGIDAYSYSSVADDYEMKHFSIKRDLKALIPYIQLAYKENPNLMMFASPWSPPGWMKISGRMDDGIKDGVADNERTRLVDSPSVYGAYSKYLAKYIKAYAAHNITINRLLVQNETDAATKYPSCVMPPSQMYKFISGYLRPEFNSQQIRTKIWAGTFRTPYKLDALEFAGNKAYLDSVDGIGIQYTLPKYISDINCLIGNKPKMHTESNCFNGNNSYEQALSRLSEVASYINGGIPNFCYWNMILNETGMSGWNWKQNSLINIDRTNKVVTYNPDYAAMYILSRFLQPGAVRIAVSVRTEDVMAVKREEKIYLFVANATDKEKLYACSVGDANLLKAVVPAKSLAVIEIDGYK